MRGYAETSEPKPSVRQTLALVVSENELTPIEDRKPDARATAGLLFAKLGSKAALDHARDVVRFLVEASREEIDEKIDRESRVREAKKRL